MNNKGFYSIINLMIWAFLLIMAVSALAFQNARDAGAKVDVNNVTSSLQWRMLNGSNIEENSSSGIVIGITYDFVNFLGKTSFTMAREGAKFSANHPEIPWKTIIYLLIAALLLPAISGVVRAILYLYVFFKEVVVSKREKRKLLELKKKRGWIQ